MTDKERTVLEEMAQEDRRRTRRERMFVAAILVIGVVLALIIGYEFTATDIGYKSIKCEQGDVVLVLERADGTVERVECPTEVAVTP